MPSTIADRTVLVTGANRGLGRALVDEALARGAARVYAAARRPVDVTDERVTSLLVDVTVPEQIEKAAEGIDSLDVLINNSGVSVPDDLSDRSAFDHHFAVNLHGPLDVTQAFLPALEQSRGAIVNVVSLGAVAAIPVLPAYSASKAAELSITQSLRALLAGRGIGVHAVLAGPIDTDMVRALDVPKTPPHDVARAIFDGVERGEQDIFPDPMSQQLAEGWANGVTRVLERQNAALVPPRPQDFTTSLVVDQSPGEVFAAVTDPRAWWSQSIEGGTAQVGDEFLFAVAGVHESRQRLVEVLPDQRVIWLVTEADMSFLEHRDEWVGTRIVFDIAEEGDRTRLTFTHEGLVPQAECYDACMPAWTLYVEHSLRRLIETGAGDPDLEGRTIETPVAR
jgi:NAD(P)-dependent dehydrogenase (short-subunit alcohol dehydrogenase family)